MTTNGRRDANHAEIRKAIRAVGASVFDSASVGGGFPDLVVGFRGVNYLLEIKDGSKPPSRRKLTEAEQEFHDGWRGAVVVVLDIDEALRAIGAIE